MSDKEREGEEMKPPETVTICTCSNCGRANVGANDCTDCGEEICRMGPDVCVKYVRADLATLSPVEISAASTPDPSRPVEAEANLTSKAATSDSGVTLGLPNTPELECCADWRPQMDVLNGYIVTHSLRVGHDTYPERGGKTFLFCPWCGVKRNERSVQGN